MKDYASALYESLIDYTEWVSKQPGILAGSPGELRGVFYNKLIAHVKELCSDVRCILSTEDILVTFNRPGYISNLSFKSEGSPTPKAQLTRSLNQALLEIDVVSIQDRFSYELHKVIIDLKKSLNHGRK